MPAVAFSCEFFPPKTDAGLEKLHQIALQYASLNPAFFSVTFGAGGSTCEHTPRTVSRLQAVSSTALAPHLSCRGASKDQISALLDRYQAQGIQQLVVLRGDAVDGEDSSDPSLCYASDLVQFIRQTTGDHFFIDVAAYPECHPEAASLQQDVDALKAKQEAGANRAMTQYFYNVDAFCHFRDWCDKAGVHLPIVPGVMPISDFANLQRFSKRCEAELPRWLAKQMSHYDDKASQYALGLDIVTRLCERLIAEGVDELHFYTLNSFNAVSTLLQRLSSHVLCA